MAHTIVNITDLDKELKTVKTEVNYDFTEEEIESDGEISSATAYGYVIHYLFETGIINHYINDALDYLETKTAEQTTE